MKRFVIIMAIMFSMVAGLSARTFVLATAVSNYGDEDVNLSQTTKDAKAFKKVMETQTKDITLLTSRYANKENIFEKLRAICNRAQKDDTIVFFFSGHGMSGGICVYDDVITYSELVNVLATSEAKCKIAYIDACHAGTLGTDAASSVSISDAATGENNMMFFVSCRGDEYSMESSWVGAGFFTQALIKGLRGKSDSNSDRKITAIELFRYIYNDVVKRSKSQQHPQLIAPKALHNAVIAQW